MTNALFVAWRSGESTGRGWGPVGRLERHPGGYRFLYTRGARTLRGFRPFPEMPHLDAIYESSSLFPLFANRLLASSRPEYEAYLAWSGFNATEPPDPIALLSVTEGRRATDSIELFPCPMVDADGCYINKFFLHGVAYMGAAAEERIGRLQPDEPLLPMLDILNDYDREAVAVRTSDAHDRVMIGYVPRYLAREVRELCESCSGNFFDLRVERVNQSAPLQQRLLCRLNACWPEGFHPCAHEDFAPIVSQRPAHAF